MVHFAHDKHFFFRKCQLLSFHDCFLLFVLVWNDIWLFLVVSGQSQDIWPAFSTEFSLSERPSALGKDFLCLMHSDLVFPQTCVWISLLWTISDDRGKTSLKKETRLLLSRSACFKLLKFRKHGLLSYSKTLEHDFIEVDLVCYILRSA